MNILFVHQNFPGQYKNLAPELARKTDSAQNRVIALRMGQDAGFAGIEVVGYEVKKNYGKGHPHLEDLQVKLLRAEAAAGRAQKLKESGFQPDVILAHPGWGETLLLKDLWPDARIGLFSEFFYHVKGSDVGFDPEFQSNQDTLTQASRLKIKNTNQLLAFLDAERGIAPTEWQKSLYPTHIQQKMDVIHDGIDTDRLKPNEKVSMTLNGQRSLTKDDEVITFVNRNLEPYRGYHQFMRALPELMKRRPNARIMIVGGHEVSYGAAPPPGKTWRQIFWDEVKDRVDVSRVHFLGKLNYPEFIQLLQLSAVHVYLTYPFVLSWSLMEAMSLECAIVASNTAPVQEVIQHEQNGLLVDFFNPEDMVQSICRLLENPKLAKELGQAARKKIVTKYDLKTQCLPMQMAWVHQLGGVGNA